MSTDRKLPAPPVLTRRAFLEGAVAAGAVVALAPAAADAREAIAPLPDAVGMLHDSTRCVGCGACVAACDEANGSVPGDAEAAQREPLSAVRSAVQERDAGHGARAHVKRQCMQCVDPACASACMMGALHKEGEGKRAVAGERRGTGIVVYDADLCVGCRYCQIACPFDVPRFEWRSATPKIVKCQLCRHRARAGAAGPAGAASPACCEVCPAEAVVYGRRADLLAEAHRRIAAEPARYAGSVFGEVDGGGTQVLYLLPASATAAQLGFPQLSQESTAHFSERVSHAPYLHGLTPFALYAAAALVIRRHHREAAQPVGGAAKHDDGAEGHR